MKIASNASPLIFLAKIRKLGLLEEHNVSIPEEVLDEIKRRGNSEDAEIISCFVESRKIAVKNVQILRQLDNYTIGKGEKSAISLAFKENSLLLIDEKRARSIARLFGLKVRGTLGVIAETFDNKQINKHEARELVRELIKAGYRIEEFLLLDFLKKFD